jgi:hypothetical protein
MLFSKKQEELPFGRFPASRKKYIFFQRLFTSIRGKIKLHLNKLKI